jgi:osmotically-inducible protein OsmY
MKRRALAIALVVLITGCNQQDADGLGRVGKKVLAQAGTVTDPLRDRFDSGVRGLASVKERVQARLQWDTHLANIAIEVHATAGSVELKGHVKTDEQRRRAVDLAESTQGVECVRDSLEVTP